MATKHECTMATHPDNSSIERCETCGRLREKRDVIPAGEYLAPENGWCLYRSFLSREAAWWYFERLPDTEMIEYRLVDHPTRFIIACRDSNLAAQV